MTMTKFDRDTAVVGGEGNVSGDWLVLRAPNGGYLAAMLVNAIAAAVEPGRRPRSLTIHYVSAPAEGPVSIAVEQTRRGGRFTFLSARMEQAGAVVAQALAAFSEPGESLEFHEEEMPGIEPAAAIEPLPPGPPLPPFASHWEMRPAFAAAPFMTGDRAESGGWIRLREPRSLDYPLVAALTDAWFPAVFPRLVAPEAVPTIDLTIHFRAGLPLPSVEPGDHVLAHFRSRHAGGGFVEEDGHLWAQDGTLIAQSRQLALLEWARAQ